MELFAKRKDIWLTKTLSLECCISSLLLLINSLTHVYCVFIYIVFFIALYQLRSVSCLSYTNKWNEMYLWCSTFTTLHGMIFHSVELSSFVLSTLPCRYLLETQQVEAKMRWSHLGPLGGVLVSLSVVLDPVAGMGPRHEWSVPPPAKRRSPYLPLHMLV